MPIKRSPINVGTGKMLEDFRQIIPSPKNPKATEKIAGGVDRQSDVLKAIFCSVNWLYFKQKLSCI
jgi:hypothetical protein